MFNLLHNLLTTVHVVLTEGGGPAVLHNPVGQGLKDPRHQPLPLSLTHLANKEKWGVSDFAKCYVTSISQKLLSMLQKSSPWAREVRKLMVCSQVITEDRADSLEAQLMHSDSFLMKSFVFITLWLE